MVFSAMNFLSGFRFGLFICQAAWVSSCMGVQFTTNCFGTLFGPFSLVFHHRLQSVDLIKHWSWTLFYSGPYAFSLMGEKFACLWPSCPIFHSVFCYEFPLWVQFWLFIYQSARGYISQPTVLELCFGPFFPVFHHRLQSVISSSINLGHLLQWALSFFPLCWENLHVCGHF